MIPMRMTATITKIGSLLKPITASVVMKRAAKDVVEPTRPEINPSLESLRRYPTTRPVAIGVKMKRMMNSPRFSRKPAKVMEMNLFVSGDVASCKATPHSGVR